MVGIILEGELNWCVLDSRPLKLGLGVCPPKEERRNEAGSVGGRSPWAGRVVQSRR